MSLWNVAVMAQSLTREIVSVNALAYKRVVRTDTRQQAIEKCIPGILEVAQDADPTIRYISVYCGRKGSVTGAASRIDPVAITRDGQFKDRRRTTCRQEK